MEARSEPTRFCPILAFPFFVSGTTGNKVKYKGKLFNKITDNVITDNVTIWLM